MTEQIKRGYGAGLQAIDFSDISGQIEKAKKKSNLLLGLAIGLLASSLIISYLLYGYFVGRYAVIQNLEITQDASSPRKVYFNFHVKDAGVVLRGYEKATSEDIVSANSKQSFYWLWEVDPSKKEFEVYIRSRSSLMPAYEKRTFSVTGK